MSSRNTFDKHLAEFQTALDESLKQRDWPSVIRIADLILSIDPSDQHVQQMKLFALRHQEATPRLIDLVTHWIENKLKYAGENYLKIVFFISFWCLLSFFVWLVATVR